MAILNIGGGSGLSKNKPKNNYGYNQNGNLGVGAIAGNIVGGLVATKKKYTVSNNNNNPYLSQQVLDYIKGKKPAPAPPKKRSGNNNAGVSYSNYNPYQQLQELYNLQAQAAQKMYDSTMSQYDIDKAQQKTKLDNSSNEAYQQAYLNYMLQKKEMPQLLAAMGISGGGAESTVSSMQNSYGQSRNKIYTQRLQATNDLEAQYARLKKQAKTEFDKQMYEYDLQLQKSKAGL